MQKYSRTYCKIYMGIEWMQRDFIEKKTNLIPVGGKLVEEGNRFVVNLRRLRSDLLQITARTVQYVFVS